MLSKGSNHLRQVMECARLAATLDWSFIRRRGPIHPAPILCFFIFLIALASPTQAAVIARLDRDTTAVGDPVTLEIQIQNAAPQAQPIFQSQPSLSIEYTGTGRQISIFNGQTTTAYTLSFTVTAIQPGAYTIPATTIQTDTGNFNTQPLRLTVTRDDSAAANAAAFIRLQVTKTNIYVGEMIPIEIKVYGLLIDELQVPVLKSEGFVIGAQAQGVRSREQVGNNIYNVYTFPISIAAAKAGSLTLGPAEAAMLVRVPLGNRRRGDIFEEMMGAFQRKQMTARSETVAINVMPLPTQNRPQIFSGAVGNFQIRASAAPTNVSVGDPITLSIQIQGRGSFDSVKLPDFGWKDFTFYQPTTSVTNTDRLGLQGTKFFDQVIVPQRAGIGAIPQISFSFFDPEARAYKTVTRAAIPISVKATGHGQAQPTVIATPGAEDQKQTPATDIVHIKPSLGQIASIGAPIAARPWFIALQLLPIALWGAAIAWRKQRDRFENDPRLRRQREVSKIINDLFPKLREHAAARRSDEFFAVTFRLLQEQLGERLDVPAAAITEAVVEEKLPSRGASTDLLKRLDDLFQACNQARYAGTTVADMEALIPKIEQSLADVRKLPPGGGPR